MNADPNLCPDCNVELKPSECCGALTCDWCDGTPCSENIEVVSEEYDERNDDWYWVHACEKHGGNG